ncbi:hypothetical protein LP414_25055 [Polaromonas sp. P1(28)-13]|nr:hypothetical protein LP414_25055 [Polaromonas sp. P1(28)-13]
MRKSVAKSRSKCYVFHSCLRNISGGKRPLSLKKSAISRTCCALGNEFASYRFHAASRITGITQDLWASRTANELYQPSLNWNASYDANSNRLPAIDKTIFPYN